MKDSSVLKFYTGLLKDSFYSCAWTQHVSLREYGKNDDIRQSVAVLKQLTGEVNSIDDFVTTASVKGLDVSTEQSVGSKKNGPA